MKLEKYMYEKAQLQYINRFLRLIIFFLIVAIIVLSVTMYYGIGKNRTVIVPLSIGRPVEISDNDADDNYIRYLARYITNLALTYNSVTVSEQFAEFLKLVHPSVYGKFETLFLKQAEIVKLTLVTSAFYLENIKIDRTNKTLLISGRIVQLDARGTKIRDERVNYMIKYNIDLGRFYITDFVECKEGLCVK